MTGRFDQFYSLEPGKQQRILHAALEEFAAQGFSRASTNAIVKAAGIGKGMLFYYFGSKEELFEFLCEYALEAPQAFLRELRFDTGDFLERYQALAQQKQRILQTQPQLMRFIESLYRADAHAEKFAARLKSLRDDMHSRFHENLDYTLLRDDVAPERAIEYMKWLLERYEQDLTGQIITGEKDTADPQALQEEWQRFYDFLTDLRTIFYK